MVIISKNVKKKTEVQTKEEKVKQKKESNYNSDKIRLLEGLEGVRMRPSMYIGDIGIAGLHHLAYEIIDNSVDETLAGFCDSILIELQPDNALVIEDNGRGIPTGIHPTKKLPTLEIIFTSLHSGGKFDKDSYKVSGGLHGVGLAVVNALSIKTDVTIYREGKEFYQEFSQGKKITEITETKLKEDKDKTGTRVRFIPDKEVFKNVDFSKEIFERERIMSRIQNMSFLNPKLTIIFRDVRGEPYERRFFSENGLVDFISLLNTGKKTLFDDIVYFEGKVNNIEITIALQYCEDTYYENILSFVNNIYTENGGTHLAGFKMGLTKAINYFAKEKSTKKQEVQYRGNDVREGLTGIVAVKVPEPQFEGQTKGKLGNSEVQNYVSDFFYNEFTKYLEKKSKIKNAILNKVEVALKGRLASQKARDIVRRKSPLEVMKLPGKLADCSSKKASECELFIVEGDSAGGSAKEARDRKTQAVLPLRGKIINVEKAPMHKIFENAEIKSLITAIGVGVSTGGAGDSDDDEEEAENGAAEEIEEEEDEDLEDEEDDEEEDEEEDVEENSEGTDAKPIELNFDSNEIPKEKETSDDSESQDIKEVVKDPQITDVKTVDKIISSQINNGKTKKQQKKVGFDIKGLRYDKIIILCDADVDGQHIKTLLLTFFFRFMRELVQKGHVYVAVPPIYKFSYKDGKKHHEEYSYEELALDEQLKKFCKKHNIPQAKEEKIHVQRYKGLGEMNPEQLGETTVNREQRKLIQVNYENYIFSDALFSKLMGNEVGPRKDYIMEHYNTVKNLDI